MSSHSIDLRPSSSKVQTCQSHFESTIRNPDVDSGYGSAATTPNPNEKESTASNIDHTRTLSNGRILISAKGQNDLKEFDTEVDKTTVERFLDVVERLQLPLLQYMQNSEQKYYPMALRLMSLGRTEEDAKAWIVVLCPEHRVKRVRRFFTKPLARDLCEPRDEKVPSFEVAVFGMAPQTRAGDTFAVFSRVPDPKCHTTLCGKLITLSAGNQKRIGTLGGMVKILLPDGRQMFCGMTAHHFAHATEYSNASPPAFGVFPRLDAFLPEFDDSASDESGWDSSEEEIPEQDLPLRSSIASTHLQTYLGKELADPPLKIQRQSTRTARNPEDWHFIGRTLDCSSYRRPSSEEPVGFPYYDWALVKLESAQDLKDNILRDGNDMNKYRRCSLEVPSSTEADISAAMDVVMDSGLRGIQQGTLSHLPCSILLSPGRKFVRAYSFRLRDGDRFLQGDSCSWVIDPTTWKVYGHLVASDVFDDGYVFPLRQSLAEMKDGLGADDVSLPNFLDIFLEKTKRELLIQVEGNDMRLRLQDRLRRRHDRMLNVDLTQEFSVDSSVLEPPETSDSGYSSLHPSNRESPMDDRAAPYLRRPKLFGYSLVDLETPSQERRMRDRCQEREWGNFIGENERLSSEEVFVIEGL